MEDLLAKEKMTNYFVKTMPLSNLHFKVPQFNLIFEVSKQQQTITFSVDQIYIKNFEFFF